MSKRGNRVNKTLVEAEQRHATSRPDWVKVTPAKRIDWSAWASRPAREEYEGWTDDLELSVHAGTAGRC